jgi:hypothetical protein
MLQFAFARASPAAISPKDLAPANWQNGMATNWAQRLKAWAWRSAFYSYSASAGEVA